MQFETFNGTDERLKALLFLQQFDTTFAGGHFTEWSKICKATTFLKGNALWWWNTLQMQGFVPMSWIQFKQMFLLEWLTNTFEVDVYTTWNKLDSQNCKSLEEYNQMFLKAFCLNS